MPEKICLPFLFGLGSLDSIFVDRESEIVKKSKNSESWIFTCPREVSNLYDFLLNSTGVFF